MLVTGFGAVWLAAQMEASIVVTDTFHRGSGRIPFLRPLGLPLPTCRARSHSHHDTLSIDYSMVLAFFFIRWSFSVRSGNEKTSVLGPSVVE